MKNIQKLLLPLCWIVGLGQAMFAQEELTYPNVERQTLSYFYKWEWKKLIGLGDSALLQGMDYYGLRYRLGVAHYTQKNYWQSITHFDKTLEFNSADPYAPEYLYYSYLFTDREGDALRFAQNYPDSIRKRWNAQKNRWLDYLSLGTGVRLSSQPDSVGHMGGFSIGLGHRLGTFLRLDHSFSFIAQNYLGLSYHQYDYYMKASVLLPKGWKLIPTIHYIHLKGGYNQRLFRVDGPTDIENVTKENSLLLYLALQKNFGRVVLKPYGAYMGLSANSFLQVRTTKGIPPIPPVLVKDTTFVEVSTFDKWQFGLETAYRLPIWDNRLTLSANIGLHLNNEGRFKAIWGATLHGQLSNRFSLLVNFFRAPVTDFVQYDGAVFNNAISPTNWGLGVQTEYYFNTKISWNISYSVTAQQEENFNFYYHNVFTGLKFRL